MTIINQLAKLCLKRLHENTGILTNRYIKNVINQFENLVKQSLISDEKLISAAGNAIAKVQRLNEFAFLTIGKTEFLDEMQRFVFLAESFTKDATEQTREQHMVRRFGLLTLLEVERLKENTLTKKEKQILYDFSKLILDPNTTAKAIWENVLEYEEQLLIEEDRKWYRFWVSPMVNIFDRFLTDVEDLTKAMQNLKSQKTSSQSSTTLLAASLNVEQPMVHLTKDTYKTDVKPTSTLAAQKDVGLRNQTAQESVTSENSPILANIRPIR